MFPLKELQTTAGLPVEVIDTGLPNTNPGPDFIHAKMKINGTLWVGNIDICPKASDWSRHGHDYDEAYDTVILHIASEIDSQVKRSDGELIPQMQLCCPEQVSIRYEQLKNAVGYSPCYKILSALPVLTIHSWLSALQCERFNQKADLLGSRLNTCGGNWEDAFFVTLARNFGFGLNGDAFEKWASLLPFRVIDKYRDNLFQVEAFFFGLAGLLEENSADVYYCQLQKEYAYFRHVFSLSGMNTSDWHFPRSRPGNFPHVRIAQLSYLYYSQRALLSRVIGAGTLKEVKSILRSRTSRYWETHYLFDKTSPGRSKFLSDSSLHLIIINTVVTFLYAYGKHKANDLLCERAGSFLEGLGPENNYIIRMWNGVGMKVSNAADSQALLQLKKEYCDKKRCLRCRIGFEFLRS